MNTILILILIVLVVGVLQNDARLSRVVKELRGLRKDLAERRERDTSA